MKGTRILALALALIMVLALVPTAMAEDEPIKISVAGYMFGPIDNEKDVITPAVEKMLKEKHGINVDIEVVYIEQGNYGELLNTRLSGGTAPDVFLAQSTTTLNEYLRQGVIKTWDEEFFKENAPDVYNFIMGGAAYGDLANDVEAWKKAAMRDGKMIVLPSFKPDGSMPYKTLIYRGDWLDKLGVTEETLPKTVDDFVALMERFTKEDPDGNGQDDTYGCSITAMKALFGSYGLGTGFSGSNSYWVLRDGKVVSSDVADDAKAVIGILADMYAKGLIDKEFVAGKESVEGSYWAAPTLPSTTTASRASMVRKMKAAAAPPSTGQLTVKTPPSCTARGRPAPAAITAGKSERLWRSAKARSTTPRWTTRSWQSSSKS